MRINATPYQVKRSPVKKTHVVNKGIAKTQLTTPAIKNNRGFLIHNNATSTKRNPISCGFIFYNIQSFFSIPHSEKLLNPSVKKFLLL